MFPVVNWRWCMHGTRVILKEKQGDLFFSPPCSISAVQVIFISGGDVSLLPSLITVNSFLNPIAGV